MGAGLGEGASRSEAGDLASPKHRSSTRAPAWTAGTGELGPARVHRIVITGGPCAGKTTAMSKLSLRLTNMGFDVFVVPELATLTITGGASPGSYSREEIVGWETALLRAQMALEDCFEEIATKVSLPQGTHAVLLCDRGTMDVLAYVGKDAFDEVLEENGWTIPQLRDQRYEAVVHLVTAAIGAEAFYTLENNKARMETTAEATSLDGKLSRAWVGHNNLHIIENAGGFEEKMRRTAAAVCESLGVPGPRAKPHWWIVEFKDTSAGGGGAQIPSELRGVIQRRFNVGVLEATGREEGMARVGVAPRDDRSSKTRAESSRKRPRYEAFQSCGRRLALVPCPGPSSSTRSGTWSTSSCGRRTARRAASPASRSRGSRPTTTASAANASAASTASPSEL